MITPIVMIPGTQCNEDLWNPLYSYLDNSFVTKHAPIELESTKKGMLSVIGRYSADKAHILGFSMGAYLALEYALLNPETIASLVIISSNAEGLSNTEQNRRKDILTFLENNTYKGISSNNIKSLLHSESQSNLQIINTIKKMDKKLGQVTLQNQLREVSNRKNLSPHLSQINCPTLIIGGKQDPKVLPQHLNSMADKLSNASCKIIDNCGHMVPLEQPQMLGRLLNEFYLSI